MKKAVAPFRFRGFVSMLMAVCFAGLAVSGIIMYIAPPCGLAEATNWTYFALTKVQWVSLHQVAALMVLILAVIHLFIFNWKTFKCYFQHRIRERRMGGTGGSASAESASDAKPAGLWSFRKVPVSRELILALLAGLIIIAGAITMKAPFGWLHDTGEAIKDSYREEHPVGFGTGRVWDPAPDHDSDAGEHTDRGPGRGMGQGQNTGRSEGRDISR